MSDNRENWSARSGFIIAAIGSAVGLGNIWRFPYVAYENGGGAFLVPYLIAIFAAGLPLLFLDYAVGHKFRKAPPTAYKKLMNAESLGWWQVMVTLVIGIYYASVLSWAGSYMFYSFGQKWGADTQAFFFSTYLQNGEGLALGFVPTLFFGLVAVWAVVMFILYGGVRRGVELANKIFMPLLVILFTILVIQAVRLPGATEGLNAFFTPNWDAMTNYKVWLAAFGHIFFSLSVGFGIMLTYASYLKKKTNLTGSGVVVALANSSFEILAGIGVFAALGFMAHSAGASVQDVVSGGIGLAFIAFPKIISSMGAGGDLFGFLFFASLVVAGITSMVSILEVPIASFQDKLAWSRKKSVTIIAGGSAVVSTLIFSTHSAITFVDIIDYFANNIGIVGGGLLSIILVSWFRRPLLQQLQAHVNEYSSIKLGKGWNFLVTVITPLSLLVALVLTFKSIMLEGYGGYASHILWIVGGGTMAFLILGAIVLACFKDKVVEEK
ncbi:sodium-dependent transporter [Acinetobacter cumulans]|jgi:NSS family neurotransmitter:Na+ symporter|uniref:Transporter n=1 Tax=Acinetobacter cumulans TaxID=2136182 RepID=A0A498D8V9_9GAMM|nr:MULTISPECIES: sodium-dependent transporter [Acinetobacter]NWK76254.1 sodium-dependent transporter [Acinetobacter sp. SwsAc6]QCO20758.1 sodium-dependent transporter [Acinetobacter cumulans]RFS23042.1 sodium-dependent transporter [Acinetobacter sp. SWAC5]RKG42806.1 sodium-dependent transporter [Acinetobacter cumulans]RKG43158.1 sodium-dependent transporter [Acinetobacter cumulans]